MQEKQRDGDERRGAAPSQPPSCRPAGSCEHEPRQHDEWRQIWVAVTMLICTRDYPLLKVRAEQLTLKPSQESNPPTSHYRHDDGCCRRRAFASPVRPLSELVP